MYLDNISSIKLSSVIYTINITHDSSFMYRNNEENILLFNCLLQLVRKQNLTKFQTLYQIAWLIYRHLWKKLSLIYLLIYLDRVCYPLK